VPPQHDSKRSKTEVLRDEGTLNPTPERVRDPKFRVGEFFDPRDAVQVKYEMLRRVSSDSASVSDAADEYGVSRPTYYQAKANFDAAGIAGLAPKKRGPQGPHKLHLAAPVHSRPRLISYRRAISAMPEPGCSVSATILSFSPRLQRRRRSTPVMISMLLAAFDLNGAHTNAS